MTDAERIYAEYRAAWPDTDTALKVAAMEIVSLSRTVSHGFVRPRRPREPMPGKPKPPAVVIQGEPDA
jgi:hypothetical protein